MSFHEKFTGQNFSGIGFSSEPEGLSLIHKPNCAAAIWERTPLKRFQDWINKQKPVNLPKSRLILPPEMVATALNNIVESSGLPSCVDRNLLVEDISALTLIFARTMHAPYVRFHLKVISTNACRKFHTDNIRARLICTYRGKGTQYGKAKNGADPTDIKNLSTGSAIIMRGTLWPEHPNLGLLHRSPPIEGTGETRLVLVVDPIEDPDRHKGEKILH